MQCMHILTNNIENIEKNCFKLTVIVVGLVMSTNEKPVSIVVPIHTRKIRLQCYNSSLMVFIFYFKQNGLEL